jgi:hypothetical protein
MNLTTLRRSERQLYPIVKQRLLIPRYKKNVGLKESESERFNSQVEATMTDENGFGQCDFHQVIVPMYYEYGVPVHEFVINSRI